MKPSTEHLKEKASRRVDKCLMNLIKYSCDQVFNRMIKSTKGKNSSRLKLIQQSHVKSKKISFDKIKRYSDSEKWLIESESGGKIYHVGKINDISQQEK